MMTTTDLMPEAGERVLCAVSGGLDSMCLLHLLREWTSARGGAVLAAHFNHQLRETADRDENFVREICAQWEIPLAVERGEVREYAEREGRSLEEAARTLRYDFLRRTAEAEGCGRIYTAHHAGDNAETMLWNLIRGTGLKGLAGIPRQRDGLCRPLLETPRESLEEYAAAHGIPHVEDETNADPDAASRNFLRQRVLPLLRELNPRAVEHMARTAAILAREDEALEALAETAGAPVVRRGGSRGIALTVLESWPRAVSERLILRLMGEAVGHRRDFTARHVQAALALETEGGTLSLPHGLLVRREGDCLWFEKAAALPRPRFAAMGETVSFEGWTVTLAAEAGEGGISYCVSLPEGASLTVTPWRSDDRMTLPGARGARTLKRLCAEGGISPRERDRLPVLRAGEVPAAVPGVGVDQAFAPRPDGAAVYVIFQRQEETTDAQ